MHKNQTRLHCTMIFSEKGEQRHMKTFLSFHKDKTASFQVIRWKVFPMKYRLLLQCNNKKTQPKKNHRKLQVISGPMTQQR